MFARVEVKFFIRGFLRGLLEPPTELTYSRNLSLLTKLQPSTFCSRLFLISITKGVFWIMLTLQPSPHLTDSKKLKPFKSKDGSQLQRGLEVFDLKSKKFFNRF